MVQQSLINYVRAQLRAGYSLGDIKNYLVKYGYTEDQINEALHYIPQIEIRHVIHPSKTTVALVVAVLSSLLLITGVIFLYALPEKAPSKLLDVKINMITNSVSQGDDLRFTVELSNLGGKKRYDVSLKYEILSLKDDLLQFEEETIALETKASSEVTIVLGDVSPGNYYLRAIAMYDKKTAKATSSFKVVAKETGEPGPVIPEKKCHVSCNDNNACTNDYCDEDTNYECKYDMLVPCCGNGICESDENFENCLADCKAPAGQEESIFDGKSIWERINITAELARRDKDKALQYCKEIEQSMFRYGCLGKVAISSNDDNVCVSVEDDSYRDSCYRDFATTSRNSAVCEKIVADQKRDNCYLNFVAQKDSALNDYTVCDKITNKYLKQSCDSLKKMSEISIPDTDTTNVQPP